MRQFRWSLMKTVAFMGWLGVRLAGNANSNLADVLSKSLAVAT